MIKIYLSVQSRNFVKKFCIKHRIEMLARLYAFEGMKKLEIDIDPITLRKIANSRPQLLEKLHLLCVAFHLILCLTRYILG